MDIIAGIDKVVKMWYNIWFKMNHARVFLVCNFS